MQKLWGTGGNKKLNEVLEVAVVIGMLFVGAICFKIIMLLEKLKGQDDGHR